MSASPSRGKSRKASPVAIHRTSQTTQLTSSSRKETKERNSREDEKVGEPTPLYEMEEKWEDPVQSPPIFQYVMFAAALLLGAVSFYVPVYHLPRKEEDLYIPDFNAMVGIVFPALIAIEWLVLCFGAVPKSTGAKFQFADAWSSFVTGLIQVTSVLIMNRFVPILSFYVYLYDNFRLIDLPETALVYILAIVAIDWCLYWLHRHTHVYNFMWSGHAVHHAAEYYNLWTGLRIAWSQATFGTVYFFPLALCIPPSCWWAGLVWNPTIYAVWVHTSTIRKLPWLIEYIFVTPSHHRLHHDRRLHKNYGSLLIIWDRIFNTFQEETEHCKTKHGLKHQGDETCYFGVKEPLDSWTECVLQVQHWRPCFSRGIAGFFKGPAWVTSFRPHPLPIVCPKEIKRIRVCTEMTKIGKGYLWVNCILIGGSFVGLAEVVPEAVVIRLLYMLASFTTQGLMLDGTHPRCALLLELARQLVKIATHMQPNSNRRIGDRPGVDVALAVASILVVVVFRKKLLGWSVTDHQTKKKL